ncbi:MAG: hypothetical protein ACT4PK_04175 [Gammaproteobacteria bacterium]
MNAVLRGVIAGAALLAAGTAGARDKDDEGSSFGVAVDASALLGLGVSVGMPVGQRFNVRGVYHGFTYELDDIEDDSGATYEGELDLKSVGLMADYHPFKGGFRFTVGFLSNDNAINLTGMPTGGTFEVGDCTFESDSSDPLAVDGTVEFAGSAPYLGIGWGGNLNAKPGFFMTFDLGVVLSGQPEADLSGRGSARNTNAGQLAECGPTTYQPVSTYPEFQQEVQDAEDEVNEETRNFEYWPNIALGFGWRF